MRKIFCSLLFGLALFANLKAQTPEPLRFGMSFAYVKPVTPDFGSDGFAISGYWVPFDIEFEEGIPLLSTVPSRLSLGPIGSLRFNTGMLSNGNYTESIKSFQFGAVVILNQLLSNRLSLSAEYGQLINSYSLKSGYQTNTLNPFIASSFDYLEYSRREAGESFLTAWSISLSANIPILKQRNPLLGFQELQFTQDRTGQHFNAIDGQMEVSLLDVPIEDFAIPNLKLRGGGGKYHLDYKDIKYWRLGTGIGLSSLEGSLPGIAVNCDYVWGWQNSKSKYVYFSLIINWEGISRFW